jgi:endonuclease III
MQAPDKSQKALQAYQALLSFYGIPAPRDKQDPLSELIQTILSQNTSDRNTARSFSQLKRHFPGWNDVLEADVQDVIAAIKVGGLAQIKGPRIQAILRQIYREQGSLNLEFLNGMSASSIMTYLTRLQGVGPKTAACVILFALDKPALPVDTHVHRVSLRLGLVPAKSSAGRTQELLEAMLPVHLYFPFHMNVIRHGRTLCLAARPKCSECPLADLCDFGHLQASNTRL